MKKFLFKMQSLLNLKEMLEQNKKQSFIIATKDLEKENKILDNLYSEKLLLINSMKNIYSSKIEIKQLQVYNNYLLFIKEKIKFQKIIIEEKKQALKKIRLELIEITKEKKILDKFKEKQYNMYLKDEKKLEQKFIDEIISYNYNT